ncbi:MAG TPA: ABC transporter permease, partial [bacterium]|nr:ABC transporter permease [bacterium]
MFSFRRFMAVAKKEFLELRRNALFFTMTIAGPIIFFFLFAYGFPLDAKNIPMAVVNRDMTAASRSLIDAFERSADLFDLRFVTGDEKRAEREIAKGDVRLVLTIPDGFERKIQAGLPADVQALIDGAYPNTASLVGANAEAVVSAFGFEVLTKYLLLRPELESAGYTFTPIDLS